MEISYLGHSSFKLRGKEGTVVTDPFEPQSVGLSWNKTKADIVTVSHQHSDHNYLQGIKSLPNQEKSAPYVVKSPGEYEINNILIQGWSTYHDDQSGSQRGPNVIYLIEIERIHILHCGDLGHDLSENLIEEIGQVDVMLIPVGGYYTIDANIAVKIIKAVSPSIVIPMHYQVPGLNPEIFTKLAGVGDFLKEMGGNGSEPQDKLSVSSSALPDDTQVVVLKISNIK